MAIKSFLLAASAMVLISGVANAAPVTYYGQDDGASTSGPFTSSAAAESTFVASASTYGSTFTTDYEALPVGYQTSYSLGHGVTVTLTGPNYGNGSSGISNTTFGSLYGFNTTNGGSQWLGFPGGTATFAFASKTYSFGTYLTGLQTVFTSDLTFSFNDGTAQVLSSPINTNGGAQYFGFTDANGFTSVTITNIGNESSVDAWGIDGTTFNVSAVPLPASAPLFGGALIALSVAGYGLRRKNAASAA